MRVSDYLKEDFCIIELKARDKEGAIKEIAEKLSLSGEIGDREKFIKDVLEHLPNTVRTMEEIYRITRPGAKIYISVPYWNSWEAITDPTHKSNFNEFTFEFFDPTCKRCQDRSYYTHARFIIKKIGFGIKPFAPYLKIPYVTHYLVVYGSIFKKFLGFLASYFNNIIICLEIYLERK